MLTGPRVTIISQRRNRVSDGKGGSNDTWTDLEEFKAVLSPAKLNREGLLYTKETTEYDYVLYCKKLNYPLNNYDRINYKGRFFQVKSVLSPIMTDKIQKILLLEVK